MAETDFEQGSTSIFADLGFAPDQVEGRCQVDG